MSLLSGQFVEIFVGVRIRDVNQSRFDVFPEGRIILNNGRPEYDLPFKLNWTLPFETDGLEGEQFAGVSHHIPKLKEQAMMALQEMAILNGFNVAAWF